MVAATLFLLQDAAIADGWGDLGGSFENGGHIGVTPCRDDPLACSNPPPKDGFAVFIRMKNSKETGKYYQNQRCAFTTNRIGELGSGSLLDSHV